MQPWLIACCLLVLSSLAPESRAQTRGPAATVLIPYFEVDLDSSGSIDTHITVLNARSEPTLIHVVFWTNAAGASIDFDVILDGYDSQSLSLYDVMVNGKLPNSTSDPGVWAAYPTCNGVLPWVNPALNSVLLDRIQNGHTGKPLSAGGNCLGVGQGDNIARGYITMDVVQDCSPLFPPDDGYINGTLAMDNVIVATATRVDPSLAQNASIPVVHLEARSEIGVGDRSFWGRYATRGVSDQREPLPFRYVGTFVTTTPVINDTGLTVWREAPAAPFGGFDCMTPPALSTEIATVGDSEGVLSHRSLPLPLATQSITLSGPVSPATEGSLYMDLGHTQSQSGARDAQGWITFHLANGGGDAASHPAVQVASLPAPFPPPLMIAEIMHRPADVADANGEWIEIFNSSSDRFDLAGLTLADDGGSLTFSDPLIIEGGQRLVVCANISTAANGDFTCDVSWSGNLDLGDVNDQIVLAHPTLGEIDRVDYDLAYPSMDGASLVFTGGVSDDNNQSMHWAAATLRENTYSGSGSDAGSPGTQGMSQMPAALQSFEIQ